jgi:hypothetical protein
MTFTDAAYDFENELTALQYTVNREYALRFGRLEGQVALLKTLEQRLDKLEVAIKGLQQGLSEPPLTPWNVPRD